MISLNVLYRFVGSFSNSSANVIILCTLVLAVVVIYFRFKKLLIVMIFSFFIASLFLVKFHHKIEYIDYNFFADAVVINILLIILYALLFLKDDFIKFRDFKRNQSLIPFSYKSKEEKIKILKDDLYCTNCNSKEIMSIEKEIYSKGMHMVHLKCDNCKNIVKERIEL